jgi:hypothetical protein
MARLDVHVSIFRIDFVYAEKFRNDVLPVIELRIVLLQAKLDAHIIILVLSETKSVSFKCITVGHSSITEVNL